MLDAVEKAFDQIASAIQGPAVASLADPVRAWRNDGLGPCGSNRLDEGVGVVALVRDDCLHAQALDQLFRTRDVGSLTFGENQPQRPANGVDRQMQLGTQSAARTSDRLRATFFNAPAECWCALTMVESIKMCSISPSPATACATRCQTPSRRHRAKRIYTVCQRPNSVGRSRQGLPVRPIHSTASTNQRLSAAVRPRSPSLPGRMSLILFHTSSLNSVRTILPRSHKRQDVNTSTQM